MCRSSKSIRVSKVIILFFLDSIIPSSFDKGKKVIYESVFTEK